MNFKLQHRQILTGIPSASGIVQLDKSLYVIGDNTAWLYKLNSDFDVIDKQLLVKGINDSVIPKITKPDFEAITTMEWNGKKELLIFGSGSKSPERNTMARVQFFDSIQSSTYELTEFYNALRQTEQMIGQALNIEAAATVGNKLYLFNREHTILWQLPIKDFISYVQGSRQQPTIKTYHLDLPLHNNLQIKFSGASTVLGANQLVFVASVEDTPNTYDDGEVLGSYIGIIDLDELANDYQPQCIPITSGSEQLPIKVESVEVLKIIDKHTLKLVMVTDSDGGDSELLVGELNWQ